ncbi:MAG: acyltransferase family protein [Eubacteriales bacterium]|nr:acyltransferase family protein [Eubacteriales bacterium]
MEQQDTFDRRATNVCKGIAICIMIYYHAFGASDLTTFQQVFPVLFRVLGPYGNVCVPFFVILTGYGLGLQYLHSPTPYPQMIGKRLLRLYQSYWPVFLIGFVAAPFLSRGKMDWTIAFGGDGLLQAIQRFLLNLLGLSHYAYGDGVYTLNQTWWYMSLALFLILFLPLLCWLWKQWKWGGLLFVTAAAMLLPDLRYLAYFPAAMLGVCLAGCNGFQALHRMGKGVLGLLIRILAVLAILAAWYKLRQHGIYPVLADSFAAWGICQFSFDVIGRIPVIHTVLAFLGKHSANLFYLHSFVYCYWISTADFVFQFHYDLLIWAVILLLTLALSLTLEWLKRVIHYHAIMSNLEHRLLSQLQNAK